MSNDCSTPAATYSLARAAYDEKHAPKDKCLARDAILPEAIGATLVLGQNTPPSHAFSWIQNTLNFMLMAPLSQRCASIDQMLPLALDGVQLVAVDGASIPAGVCTVHVALGAGVEKERTRLAVVHDAAGAPVCSLVASVNGVLLAATTRVLVQSGATLMLIGQY